MTKEQLLSSFSKLCSNIDTSAVLEKDCKNYFKQPINSLTEAAVLVPIIDRPDNLTVLFTQRSKKLRDHPGQVSFPGGRTETFDKGPVDTALRESTEDIGLLPKQVEIIGKLDICLTGTGFRVVPIVGIVKPPLQLQLDEFEVADVFEIPLTLLLKPELYRIENLQTESGPVREFYALDYKQWYIWGATARMLVNLRELLTE